MTDITPIEAMIRRADLQESIAKARALQHQAEDRITFYLTACPDHCLLEMVRLNALTADSEGTRSVALRLEQEAIRRGLGSVTAPVA